MLMDWAIRMYSLTIIFEVPDYLQICCYCNSTRIQLPQLSIYQMSQLPQYLQQVLAFPNYKAPESLLSHIAQVKREGT